MRSSILNEIFVVAMETPTRETGRSHGTASIALATSILDLNVDQLLLHENKTNLIYFDQEATTRTLPYYLKLRDYI